MDRDMIDNASNNNPPPPPPGYTNWLDYALYRLDGETAHHAASRELDNLRRKAGILDKLASVVVLASATTQRQIEADLLNNAGKNEISRFAQILIAATRLFEGDTQAGLRWLTHPVKGLGGNIPIDMLATSAQTDVLLSLVGRLEHGVSN